MPILGILASSTAVAAGSFESIATVTVGAGGSSTISFTSIPSTYTHLQLRGIAKHSSSGVWSAIKFNSDSTGANYYAHRLYGNGSSAGVEATAGDGNGARFTTIYNTQFMGFVLDILDYANTNKNKTCRNLSGFDANGSGELNYMSQLWASTSAISRIDISVSSGNMVQYSHFALYGIKSA
jgi:hypothetical protein